MCINILSIKELLPVYQIKDFKDILRLELECGTWWWQFGCKDMWTQEFTDKFDYQCINEIKSVQEELFFV